MPDFLLDITYQLQVLTITLAIMAIFLGGLFLLGYLVFLLWKYRDREAQSLSFVLLQVATPRDNEIKIDAAEQLFASLHGIMKSGFWGKIIGSNM